MPASEVNITVDSRDFMDYGLIAGAYRVALDRNNGHVGIFHLDRSKHDEYDAIAMAINLALENLHQSLSNKQVFSYNQTVYSEYGNNIWHTLMAKKPDAYRVLYNKLNANPNVTTREGLTRQGNNPLRNHTYVAAIKGLTGIQIAPELADSNPHQWFTLQKVFTECYSPMTNLGTPATDNLRNNALEMQHIQEQTPDVSNALSKAIEYLETRETAYVA